MNKKLYLQLFAAMLVGHSVVADNASVTDNSFLKRVGRALNGNGNSTVVSVPVEKISFSDAKDLKRQMRNISQNIGTLSAEKKAEVKTKVLNLADLVNKYQVEKKTKMKQSKRQ